MNAQAFAASQTQTLACPACRGVLESDDSRYLCAGCGADYPVRNGVPDFAPETDLYWGELGAPEMKEVLDRAAAAGYEAGAEVAIRYSPGLRDYLLAPCRLDWLFHTLPLSECDACLDIGSGWGTLCRPLAKYFRKVWSLEIMRERLEFQQAFKRFEKLDGLELVRASAIRLPFRDASFDVILANGIIQWVGLADKTRPVAELQAQFLRECERVLKPNGTLVLGCENRYGIFNWLGGKDHSGLRYTSLVPRRLADWIVRRYRKTGGEFVRSFRTSQEWNDYRTYTHSSRGYTRLLQQHGFHEVRGYWAHPSNNEPQYMGALDDAASVTELLGFASRNLDLRVEGSPLARTMIRLRKPLAAAAPALKLGVKTLAQEFIFIARAKQTQPVRAELESALPPTTLRYGGSNKVMWLAKRNGQRSYVKMARYPEDAAQVAREEELLARHNGLDVKRHQVGKHLLFEEPQLTADPIDALSLERHAEARAWLHKFQAETRQGEWAADAITQEVQHWLDRFCELVPDKAVQALASTYCNTVVALAADAALPRVAEHGDFWWRNILRDSAGKLYLIDWQHSRDQGDPLFDFAMLTYTFWQTWRRSQPEGAPNDSPLPQLIGDFAAQVGIPLELVYAYYPYALVRRAVRSSASPRLELVRLLQRDHFPRP